MLARLGRSYTASEAASEAVCQERTSGRGIRRHRNAPAARLAVIGTTGIRACGQMAGERENTAGSLRRRRRRRAQTPGKHRHAGETPRRFVTT